MIKTSVIIAAYNVEDYIEECLSCLLNQSIPIHEIIIVDDGSTDSTPEILKKCKSDYENIKIITQENSGGPGSPRNNGLKQATGDYIHFMDPDDLLDRDYYKKLAENIEEHNPDIILSSMEKFNSKRNWTPKTFQKVNLFNKSQVTNLINTPELIQNLSSTNKIFKKDFLLQNNLFFLTGGASEEIHFTTCCFYLAEKIYINSTVKYYWRRRESASNLSMSQQKSEFKSVKDRLASYNEIDKLLSEHNLIQFRYIKDSRAILDFLRHGNKLFEFEKKEQQQFFKIVNNYLKSIDTKAYNYIPEYARQYYLTRLFFLQNKLSYELVASTNTKYGFLPSKTIYVDGKPKVTFDLQYLEKKYGSDPLFPRNIDVPKRLINGQAILNKAVLKRRSLTLEGYGYINYLNVTSKSSIVIRIMLKDRNSSNKLVVSAEPKKSPELTNMTKHDYCGFKVNIPFSTLQNNFSNQTIDISLDIVIDGITRYKRLGVKNINKIINKNSLSTLYVTDKNNLSITVKKSK